MVFVYDSRSVSSHATVLLGAQSRRLRPSSTPPSLIQSAARVGLTDHFWYIYLLRKYASPRSHHGSLDEFFQAVEQMSSHETASKHAFLGAELPDHWSGSV